MRSLFAGAALLLAAGTAHAAPEDAFGFWLVESGKAIVEVGPCGTKACGRIVWLAEPLNDSGQPKVDHNNPDPTLAARPICGMTMIGDFSKGGDMGGWVDGFIYDPQEGKTYRSVMHATEEGNLYVRGYIGLPLLGRSQTWTPVADARGGC